MITASWVFDIGTGNLSPVIAFEGESNNARIASGPGFDRIVRIAYQKIIIQSDGIELRCWIKQAGLSWVIPWFQEKQNNKAK